MTKAQANLHSCAEWPEPSLLLYTKFKCRRDYDQKLDLIPHLIPKGPVKQKFWALKMQLFSYQAIQT